MKTPFTYNVNGTFRKRWRIDQTVFGVVVKTQKPVPVRNGDKLRSNSGGRLWTVFESRPFGIRLLVDETRTRSMEMRVRDIRACMTRL